MTGDADSLLDTIRRLVREELRQRQLPALALVQEIHPHASDGDEDNYSCTVRLHDTGLVLNKVPVVVARLGLASIPAVNDLVLVQFLDGDASRPVIAGSLYNDEDRPPANAAGQWVCRLPPGAATGEGLHLVANSEGTPGLSIRIGPDLVLSLQDDDPVVHLDVGSGAATLTIERDGTVSLKSRRDLTLEAGAELKLKGDRVTLEGSGAVTLKGATIDLN